MRIVGRSELATSDMAPEMKSDMSEVATLAPTYNTHCLQSRMWEKMSKAYLINHVLVTTDGETPSLP